MLTSAVPCSSDFCSSQLRCCGWESPQDWFHIPSMRRNESEGDRVPCSCYNSSATNDSTVFDKISPQFSRLGSLARPRHNVEVCSVPRTATSTNRWGRWGAQDQRGLTGWAYGKGLFYNRGRTPTRGKIFWKGGGLKKRPRRKGRIWNADTWG